MSNYIKEYNVGSFSIDLPYPNYVYTLPLLNFKDNKGEFKLAIIYTRKAKSDNVSNSENTFNIDYGYKLNIHKKIIIENDVLTKFIDENGRVIELINNNGIYTFIDESQRIIRKTSTGYELEDKKLFKEIYNLSGDIIRVYDGYGDIILEYTYTNSLLTSIKYNNTKTVTFSYSSNKLSSISYAGTTTSFVYNTVNKLTINHYSGVIYILKLVSSSYIAEVSGEGVTYTKKATLLSSTITISELIGSDEVDTTTYSFPGDVITDYKPYGYVEITNKLGYKERIQYEGLVHICSYEINNDVTFTNNRFLGSVSLYNALDIKKNSKGVGVLKATDGVTVLYNAASRKWKSDVSQIPSHDGYFLLTGWIKSQNVQTVTMCVSNQDAVAEYAFEVNINKAGIWHFFSFNFYLPANFIYVYPFETTGLELNDVRLTFQKTQVMNNATVSHTILHENILIDRDSNVISFNDVEFNYFLNGTNHPLDNITINDIYKYKIERKRGVTDYLVYHNNCKEIIDTPTYLRVIYNESLYSISEFEIGVRYYSSNKEHKIIYKIDETNPTSNIEICTYINGSLLKTNELNSYLDTIKVTEEDTIKIINRQKHLVLSESVSGLYEKTYQYGTNLITETNEFGKQTKYHIDSTWGTVYKIELPDGTIIQDTYDDDKSVLLSRKIGTTTNNRINNFNYSKGYISNHTSGNLDYDYYYDEGKLNQVNKFNNVIEKINSTDTNTTYYYPDETNTIYSVSYNHDKYNRINSVTNVLENTYDINPIFDNNGNLSSFGDNKDAYLVISEDKIKGEKSRYERNDHGLLCEVITSNSSNYTDKISEESFEYDSAERMTKFTYNYSSQNKAITEDINYIRSASSANVDNRISKSTYTVNNTNKLETTYTYDTYKRIQSKKFKINSTEFTKSLAFYSTRISSETNDVTGTITYEYDNCNRIVSITSDGDTTSYVYDVFGQLIRENNAKLDKTIVYEYNTIGNITSKKVYSYTTSSMLTGTPIVYTYTYDTTIQDRLINYNGTSINYNTIGCPSTYNGFNVTWNNGKLSSLQKGSRVVGIERCTFSYNAKGQRVSKVYSRTEGTNGLSPILEGEVTSSSKTYKYDYFGRLISETDTRVLFNVGTYNEVIDYLYDGNVIIGMVYTLNNVSNTYYFNRNLQGDVLGIYDSNKNLKVKYLYDAYGNCTIASQTTDYNLANANPIRYRGYYYDLETNLLLVSSRYYSPELCRWISPDDIEYLDPESVNGLNLYCYCFNNPVMCR